MRNRYPIARWRASRGFTLIELSLVTLIICIILAIAMPRLIPAIAYGEFEGAARHLASYGRSLMAHCTLAHEPVTFRIDLDNGEYWAVKWTLMEDALFDKNAGMTGQASGAPAANTPLPGGNEETALRAQEMEEQFERFVRLSMQARARTVENDGIFSDTGPLFEKEFELDSEKDAEDELKLDMLARTKLPAGVKFESVRIGTTEYTKGRAETVVTSFGLSEPIVFSLASGDQHYTVEWDAITGSAHLKSGREEIR